MSIVSPNVAEAGALLRVLRSVIHPFPSVLVIEEILWAVTGLWEEAVAARVSGRNVVERISGLIFRWDVEVLGREECSGR